MLYTSPTVLGGARRKRILEITGLNYNLVLADLARRAGWNGVRRLKADIFIRANAQIGSRSTATPALRTGSWPAGSVVRLVLEPPAGGYTIIAGHGGDGGWDQVTRGASGATGKPGGPAFQAEAPITVENHGIIGGGGGGGGDGAWGPGGGGAGLDPGARAEDGGVWSQPGSLLDGGVGHEARGRYYGGHGGALGMVGQTGGEGFRGGAPGAAILGNRLISWTVRGDIRGPVGN